MEQAADDLPSRIPPLRVLPGNPLPSHWQEPEPRAFQAARNAFLYAGLLAVAGPVVLFLASALKHPPHAPLVAVGLLLVAILGAYYIGFCLLCHSRRVPSLFFVIAILLLIAVHIGGAAYVLPAYYRLSQSPSPFAPALQIGLAILGLLGSSFALPRFVEKWHRQPRR